MSNIHKALFFGCLLLLLLAATAQAEPTIYTIKKGDTLWGLSERFIKDPYYWPNLWSHNPDVTNPHLIYPGQKIAVYDGRIVFLPTEGEPVKPDVEKVEPVQPEVQPELVIKTSGKAEGFVTLAELETAGILVDTTDSRLMMAEGDTVFIKMDGIENLQPGDLYTLISVGDRIRHPNTRRTLGHQVAVVGQVRIDAVDPPVATALVLSSEKEISRGDRLIPSQLPLQEVTLKKAEAPVHGVILGGENEKLALSQFDTIFVDIGYEDGLQEGNMLYISRSRQASRSALRGHSVSLPDVLLGAAVVVSTQPDTAAALVLKSTDAIYAGDRVVTAMD